MMFTSPPCLWSFCRPFPWSSTGSCSLVSSSPPGWKMPELSSRPHCRSGFPFSDARPPCDDVCRVTFKTHQTHQNVSNKNKIFPFDLYSDCVSVHAIPAAAHHVSRLLKVCDLIAGETNLSSSRDTFACFHVLCHGSTFTWQQRMTKTGGWKKKALIKLVDQDNLKEHTVQ